MGGKGSGRPGGVPAKDNPLMQSHRPDVDADVNRRVMGQGREIMELPPVDFADAAAIQGRFYEFLAICDKYALRPMVGSAAAAFGLNTDVFRSLANGDARYERWRGSVLTPEGRETLARCYRFLHHVWENYMMEDKSNPVRWIFLGKNYFGMKDQSEVIQTRPEEQAPAEDPRLVAARYAAMVGRPLDGLGEAEIVDVADSEG